MTTDAARRMIDYLRAHVIADPSVSVDEGTALISSGLVDSFALTQF